jgi:hypothetical protein
MTNVFDSSLWGATSTTGQGRLTNLQLTVPPASAGTSFTVNITTTSGVSVSSVGTLPTGLSWSSTNTTLTIGSAFSGTGTVTLNLSGGNVGSTSFNLVLSSAGAQNGTQTTVQVDPNGWMLVTSLGNNVAMQGLFYMIQALPSSGGLVQLDDPVLLIPKVTGGNTDFSFSVGVGLSLSGGSLSLSKSSNAVPVSISGTTVTALSSLAGGNTATVTATYTANGTTLATSTFTIQRLSSTTVTSGSSSVLNLNSDTSFAVTGLAANVYLRGTDVKYHTTLPGTYYLNFYTTTSGLQFNSSAISLTNNTGSFPYSNTTNSAQITATNQGTLTSTDFTLATSLGTLSDPTIINNPDPG